jgi:lysozyme|tara:strand:- start:7046 stop:7699 length:654 start_codon:yes stop_codon:yes gene_type:complete
MYLYQDAISIIKAFEGFNEKAYPDPVTGSDPYTFGYGTQFYPDGSQVKQGHCCTKEKALEYLLYEVNIIAEEIDKLNLEIDLDMKQGLISFIHSVGWDSFLYSPIIDLCENENYAQAAQEFGKWIFNEEHEVIGGLLDRRRQEACLFLDLENLPGGLLLKAFRNYSASAEQVAAIRQLETEINPYVLSEFANKFNVTYSGDFDLSEEDLRFIFEFQK